ncbi:MAG: hypothetical protein IKS45_12035 [Thermoguttaceae bacterium]|nr:hypothetical protein [Thermoguttaceae bacterium]
MIVTESEKRKWKNKRKEELMQVGGVSPFASKRLCSDKTLSLAACVNSSFLIHEFS